MPWRDIPGFDGLYGLQIDSMSEEEITAHVDMRDELRQPAGLLHGGVLASMAESMATVATYFAFEDEGLGSLPAGFVRMLEGDHEADRSVAGAPEHVPAAGAEALGGQVGGVVVQHVDHCSGDAVPLAASRLVAERLHPTDSGADRDPTG